MMLFGPQRGSVFTVFDKFASTFGMPIAVVVIALIFQNTQALLENGIVLIIVMAAPAWRLLGYFFTYYSVDEEKFHIKSGVINKKELEIPLDRITTVDFTQNLIFQWAGVYSVKVDNTSNYGGGGKGAVSLSLRKADAVRLKALLLSKKDQAFPEERYSRRLEARPEVIPAKKILVMGALQAKGSAVAQIISLCTLLAGMGNIAAGHEIGFEEKLLNIIMSIPGIGIAVIALAAFFILSTLLGALFSFIKYYGFRITDGEKSIHLEYGLLTKKKHSLMKDKISGVEYVQSLPMKLFGVGYLNVMAVGYGGDMEEGEEKALLYPLLGEDRVHDFTEEYIPMLKWPEKKIYRPPSCAIRYFFICPRVIVVATVIIAALILDRRFFFIDACPVDIRWIWWLFGIMLLLAVLSVIFEYKNTDIIVGSCDISFATGGFTRIRTVVRREMLESVSDRGSVFKRKRGVVTIKLGILAPVFDSLKKVKNMDAGAFDAIREIIRY